MTIHAVPSAAISFGIAPADLVLASRASIGADTMKLPIPMQQFLSRQAGILGGTSAHERNVKFKEICGMARSINDDPFYHGAFAEQLLQMGKRFLINRSEDSIRATVISELNKVVPIAAVKDGASAALQHNGSVVRTI